MKLAYMLSFVIYPLLYAAVPYVTAQTWADIVAMLAIIVGIFQLCYIIFLRKKDEVSLGCSIARFFLYFSSVSAACLIWFYIDIFFNGYSWGFLGASHGPYYGFEAWREAGWDNIIYIPLLTIFAAYIITYFVISRKHKNNT